LVLCKPYELIGTVSELIKFQTNEWYEEDPFLVQALSNIALVSGNNSLIVNYYEQLHHCKELIQTQAFKILKMDSIKFNPLKQITGDKDGELLNVKKDIYRFSDRIIIALEHCLGNIEKTLGL